jgi:hypothetical protein
MIIARTGEAIQGFKGRLDGFVCMRNTATMTFETPASIFPKGASALAQ